MLLQASVDPQVARAIFGIKIGADGELARYPKIVEYLQHLAKPTDRVKIEELGKTTMGNPYVLATISAPENLAKLNRLVEINRRLADPRGLTEAEAAAGAGRAAVLLRLRHDSLDRSRQHPVADEIAHRLATDNSPDPPDPRQLVVLLVPSQNPDGQNLVVDHWYKTKGTPLTRVYPDLYHKYAGHDDNRDWFMFTQKETRLRCQIQNTYKPNITHDMHQRAGGSRIFVPPFDDPYDPNIHPILAQGITTVGQAMATALVAEGKTGVECDALRPVGAGAAVHGLSRAAANPHRDRRRQSRRSVRQSAEGSAARPAGDALELPEPYRRGDWTLREIVDYGVTVGAGRHGARREVPRRVARKLLQGSTPTG